MEIEAFICENLVAGMESGLLDPTPIWTDVKTFDPKPFRGKIHGYIGGYPCQPFSVAGKRKATEDPRHLWPYIQRHIEAIEPIWCFFENVRGHLTLGFDEVYRSLSDMGYAVECGIFTAEEVGAPHQRERLFILAIRKDYLGNTQYNGQFTEQVIRSSETTSNKWRQEEQREAGEFKGTDRPINVKGISGCKNGIKSIKFNKNKLAHTNSNGNEKGNANRGSGQTEDGHKKENGERQRVQLQSASGSESKLANANNSRGEQDRQPAELRTGSIEQSSFNCWEAIEAENIQERWNRWPARPGEQQHEWEEPRTAFPPLGRYADGNPNRIDVLFITKTYEVYTAKKTRAIKALHELWCEIESKSNEWKVGRLQYFLKEKILFTSLHGEGNYKQYDRVTLLGDDSRTEIS